VADEDHLYEPFQELLMRIDQEELNGVFQVWMLRVHEV
jgi:hypothetical protein